LLKTPDFSAAYHFYQQVPNLLPSPT
jgi:hypothetical protein